jgi:glucose/arabinose dehydrogenase
VRVAGEGGLLGLAVDPEFARNRHIYACLASKLPADHDVRVVKWTVNPAMTGVSARADIITGLPYNDSGRHSGCRPRFGPDGYLWIGTGDAAVGTTPQSKTSLGGKVLRVDRNGAGAPGNAGNGFDARVYNYGHRNIQGIMFRPGSGQAFNTEHGSYRDDELNLLQSGGNYGWDPVPGYNESVPMTDTAKFTSAISATWTAGSDTTAPSGATFLSGPQWRDWDGAAAIAALKGQQLMIMTLNIDGTAVTSRQSALEYGVRLRSAVQGPDGNLYLSTDAGGGAGEIWKVVPR